MKGREKILMTYLRQFQREISGHLRCFAAEASTRVSGCVRGLSARSRDSPDDMGSDTAGEQSSESDLTSGR